jgi:YggT family protein
MFILAALYSFIWWGCMAVGAAGIILIVLRSLFLHLDVNPFTWHALNVRRVTDPVILPVRRMLIGLRLDPIAAPFVVVVLIIVAVVLVVQFASSLLNTAAGILYVISHRRPGAAVAIIGYLLFGFLGLYTLAIFVRIIFSWVGASYANRLMRFLSHLTEPLLRPLRRMVPLVGMFDVSPIIAFVILWLCQAAVAASLLNGWPVQFF